MKTIFKKSTKDYINAFSGPKPAPKHFQFQITRSLSDLPKVKTAIKTWALTTSFALYTLGITYITFRFDQQKSDIKPKIKSQA